MPMHSIGVYLYSMNKTCSICRYERLNTEILTLLCSVVETNLGTPPVPGDPLSQVGCHILLFLLLGLLAYPCQSCVHCQWDILFLVLLTPVTARVLFQIPSVFHNVPFGWACCSYESVLGSLPSLKIRKLSPFLINKNVNKGRTWSVWWFIGIYSWMELQLCPWEVHPCFPSRDSASSEQSSLLPYFYFPAD